MTLCFFSGVYYGLCTQSTLFAELQKYIEHEMKKQQDGMQVCGVCILQFARCP